MNPIEEAAASVRLDGDTIDVGPVTVVHQVQRPDPRLASSWCGEGVAHDHGACGRTWNSHDPREIEEAAQFAYGLGEKQEEDVEFTDKEVAYFATYITGHPEAEPNAQHLAATRAVMGGLARDGWLTRPDTPNSSNDRMPVFVIKAKDEFAISAVSAYRRLCEARGLTDQAAQVRLAAAEMSAWRERNPDAVKLPDHQHVPVTRLT